MDPSDLSFWYEPNNWPDENIDQEIWTMEDTYDETDHIWYTSMMILSRTVEHQPICEGD